MDIIREWEGLNKKNFGELFTILEERYGFKAIITHRGVEKLTPNVVYFFCEPKGNGARFPKSEEVQHVVKIPHLLTLAQLDYTSLAKTSTGALQFLSHNGAMVGYYNSKSNILWLSDLHHPNDRRGVAPVEMVLEVISSWRECSVPQFNKWKERFEGSMEYPAFTLGADPEFEIVDGKGKFISADSVYFVNGQSPKTELGTDGHSRIGELRTKPVKSPKELTSEFKRLITKAANHPNFPSDGKMCVGGGSTVPVAGHIHVSGYEPSDELLNFLGVYMAAPMNKHQSKRRADELQYCDWSINNRDRIRWNGDDHWEWRPMMAYHVSEAVTDAVHCTFYCILETYRRGSSVLVADPKAADYKKLWGYNKYKREVDLFVKTFVTGTARMEGVDVLENWLPHRRKRSIIKFMTTTVLNGKNDSVRRQELDNFIYRLNEEPIEVPAGVRVLIIPSGGGGILYHGLKAAAARRMQEELEDRMLFGIEEVAGLGADRYGNPTWDVVIQVPWMCLQREKHRQILADAIKEAVRLSTK